MRGLDGGGHGCSTVVGSRETDQRAFVKVDVGLAEAAELAAAGAGEGAEAKEDREGLRGSSDHADDLGRGRWVDVRLGATGAVDLGRRVADNEVEALGPAECGAKDVVDSADG